MSLILNKLKNHINNQPGVYAPGLKNQKMEEILKKIYPKSTEENRKLYAADLTITMVKYNINNLNRIRCFLAQIGHESAQLSRVSEKLNYGVSSLMRVFGKYFPDEKKASMYAYDPEAIANVVYANRMGNGDELSGDGWKYRGRGLIQITGKDNYTQLSHDTGVDCVSDPALLVQPRMAVISAAWFWESKKLNEIADTMMINDDYSVFCKITKIINGGMNGIEDRYNLFKKAKEVIV